MPGVDIEIIRHATGNKTKRIKLTVVHILEYLKSKRVRIPDSMPEVYVRIPQDDMYVTGEKIVVDKNTCIEVKFYEQKK